MSLADLVNLFWSIVQSNRFKRSKNTKKAICKRKKDQNQKNKHIAPKFTYQKYFYLDVKQVLVRKLF